MIIDKGYCILQKGTIDNYMNIKDVISYNRVYFSIPVEVIYKFNQGKNPAFVKSGLCIDLKLDDYTDYKPVASSFTFGVGKSFCINEIFWISIEPTIRYALFDYADQIQIIPDRYDNYRPVSAGLMISLSQ